MSSIECYKVKGRWYAYYIKKASRNPEERKRHCIGPVGGKYVREDKITRE